MDLKNRLSLLDDRVPDLRSRLDAPHFMDEFADLVTDHRGLVKAAQKKLYEQSGTREGSDRDRQAPALWDAGWRPGHGNYVPYATVYSWHPADVQAAQSSSSATTGYFSGVLRWRWLLELPATEGTAQGGAEIRRRTPRTAPRREHGPGCADR